MMGYYYEIIYKKGKENVEPQIPYQRSNKVEKKTSTSFKGKAPMRQGREWERSMQHQ